MSYTIIFGSHLGYQFTITFLALAIMVNALLAGGKHEEIAIVAHSIHHTTSTTPTSRDIKSPKMSPVTPPPPLEYTRPQPRAYEIVGNEARALTLYNGRR
jgi:hypothetical protein